MTHSFQLLPDHGRAIIGDLHLAQGDRRDDLIVFCHGYKGFKDWGAWHLMANAFTEVGFDFVRFNFSHNGGTVEQPIDFPDLEAFSENNYSLEMNDLQVVLDHFSKAEKTPLDPPKNIYLLGHSRGGGIVMLTAAQDKRINKLATLAAVSDYRARFLEGTPHFEAWKASGITHIENSRTGQLLPHKFQFYLDFIANEQRLTISKAVKELKVPQLIVHGTEDPTVALKEAQALHHWNPDSSLVVIDGADHVFGMQHPWNKTELPAAMQEAVTALIAFYSA